MMHEQSSLFRLLYVVTLDVFGKDLHGEIAWVGFAVGFDHLLSAVTQRYIAQGVEPLWIFIDPKKLPRELS